MESNISGGKHGHGRFDTVVAVEKKFRPGFGILRLHLFIRSCSTSRLLAFKA